MIVASAAARSATSASTASDSKASRPISEIDVFGSNATSSKPGPMYCLALVIVLSPPQATSLSKNCGRNSRPSTFASPPRQYAAENERVTGWSGATAAIARRIAVAREQIVGRQLQQVHALGQRAAQHRHRGDARGVAGDHVNQSRRKGAHAMRAAARRAADLAPAVEHVGTAELLVDLELHAAAIEDAAERCIRALEHAARQRTRARAEVERLREQPVGVARQPLAGLHQHVHDLGERHVEGRAGFAPRPHELVEIESPAS